MADHDTWAAVPTPPSEPPLETRLAALERLLVSQDARIAQQDARMAQQEAELTALRAGRAPDATPSTLPDADALAGSAATARRGRTGNGARASRRALLKLGGAAAAAGVAATAALVTSEGSQTAHAADHTALMIGEANTGTNTTSLAITGSSSANVLFSVDASNSNYVNVEAIAGYTNVAHGVGVAGASPLGYGVYANSASGIALVAVNGTGTGVNAASGNGVGGVFSGGRAPLNLALGGAPGAPTANFHGAGDIYLDSLAALWVCIADGTPGTWVRVATVANGALGGTITYLSTPIRLLDARTSPGTAVVTRGPLAGNETYAFTVAGLGGSGIPSSAQGLIANVTVLGPSGAGNLSLFPAPGPGPSVASMTFGTPGLFLANGVNVAIGTAGQIEIQNQSSGTTPLVLDAVAFVS
jgi:hypothetical protein